MAENNDKLTELEYEIARLRDKNAKLEMENAYFCKQNEELAADLIGAQGAFVDCEIRLKRRERIFRAMQNLYNEIIFQSSAADIYNITVKTLTEKVGYDRVVILNRGEGGYLAAAHSGYPDFEKVRGNFMRADFMKLFDGREHGFVVNASNYDKFNVDFYSLYDARSLMAVPFGRGLEYVLFLGNRNEDRVKKPGFTQPDIEIFRILGNMVSMAAGNLELYEGLERTVAERTREISQTNLLLKKEIIERTQAEKVAADALRIKNEFIANMSHEIRTPMNAIVVTADLALRSRSGRENVVESLKTIKDASHSLLMIINDILDFSKIEAGKMLMARIPFDLYGLMKKIYSVFRFKAMEKKVGLRMVVNPGIPIELVGDPIRLEQILNNLISNAIKFTVAGEVLITVFFTPGAIDDGTGVTLNFGVRDTGIGIDEAEIPKLFESFHQLDNSLTREYGGTGLGLSISKKLAELMGGEIKVESSPGAGSFFYFSARFTIPAEAKEGAREGFVFSSLNANTAAYEPTAAKDGAGSNAPKPEPLLAASDDIKALIVEDNRVNQRIARAILESRGIRADIACNGLEAVEAVKRSRYDVVFMDIQMPVMDGYAAARIIRGEEATRSLPIIAVTAHAMRDELDRCIDAGMNDYVTKPIDVELLFDKMARWMPEKTFTYAVAAGADACDYPDLPGVDIKKGVQRAGGSARIFMSVLRNFYEDYSAIGFRLKEHIARSEYRDARDLSHAVKGVAGNISAEKLYAAARNVNDSLKSGDYGHLDESVLAFDAALEEVIVGIKSNLPKIDAIAGVASGTGAELSRPSPAEAVAAMNKLLGSNNFGSFKYFKVFRKSLEGLGVNQELCEIDACLKKMDFKNSLKFLGLISNKLNIC